MSDDKKTYVGNGKRVNDYKRAISVCLDDIKPFATESKNGKHYIALVVVDLKQANQWGKDISVEIDTWKPDRKSTAKVISPEEIEESEIPF